MNRDRFKIVTMSTEHKGIFWQDFSTKEKKNSQETKKLLISKQSFPVILNDW